jgi:hypothetical protein
VLAFLLWTAPNARVPFVQSWSTSVAYQLPWQMAVEVSYLGSKGSHLFLPPIGLNNVPFELSASLLGVMPSARLVAVEGAGHLPQWEQPAIVHPALIAFLREVQP